MRYLCLSIFAVLISFSSFALGPILGNTSACAGSSTTLSNATPGGTWSSSNSCAVIDINTGAVTTSSLLGGSATITYSMGGSSVTTTFVVSNLPTPYGVTGGGSYCSGSTAPHIGLNGSQIGANYQLYIGTIGSGIAIGSPLTGTGSPVDFGTESTAGNYYVVVTDALTGCINTSSSTATITVNPLPTVYTMTGSGSYCSGGTGVDIFLSNSATGINYQLYNNSGTVGSALLGTGSALDFGLQTTAGTYTVVATNSTSGCSSVMSGNPTITINPLPTVYTVTGGGSFPLGGAGVHIGLSGSNAGISYQLYNGATAVGAPVTGTGAAIDFGLFTATGAYAIVATNNAFGCSAGMSGSATVSNCTPPATITGANTVCNHDHTQLSDITPGGMWSTSDSSVLILDAGGQVYPINPGIATISYAIGGCSTSMSFTVNPTPAAIVGPASICVGSTSSLSEATVGGAWSISGAGSVALIDPITGVVSGIAPGIATISYTLGSCSATKSFTVSATPAAITGPSSVCSGSTIILSDVITGGTWSSSNTVVATVQLTTGVVTGGAFTGTAVISYYNTGGCAATKSVTVNAMPYPITGPNSICNIYTSALSEATTGGVWSSSATSVATINSAPLVFPISAGVTNISYTLGSCSAVMSLTVNALPAVITGSTTICQYASDTLSDVTAGGTWSSSDNAIASVGLLTGAVVGVSPGTALIYYTSSGGWPGCSTTASITVVAGPGAITGASSVCQGTFAILSSSITGGTWSSSSSGIASISSGGVITGLLAGTTNISYTLSTGCSADKTFTILPQPASITGPSTLCNGASAIYSNAISGGTWSLSTPAIANIDFLTGALTTLDTGTTFLYYSISGCSSSRSISIQSPAVISGASSVCNSFTTTLNTTTSGGTWSSSASTIASVDAATGIVSGLSPGTSVISYTASAGCVSTHSITVSASPVVTVGVIGASNICSGTITQLYATTTGGSALSETWFINGTGVAPTDSLIYTAVLGDTISFQAIVSATCGTVTLSTGAPLVITATPPVSATASMACGGLYTLTPSSSVAGVSYSWLPATGLSCTACGVTTLTPAATVTYTVTGITTAGCTGMATVTVNGNDISGHITYTGVPTDVFTVWLTHYNPADSSITATDSVFTCMDGGIPYYTFASPAAGSYMVKAMLNGETPGISGYIPTYGVASASWNTATTVAHSSAADSMHINMIYGTVPAGPGFISGNVYSGAGKNTAGNVPVEGMLIYLKDVAGHVLTYAYTDGAGSYSFANLAYGDYIIYPENFGDYTTPSSIIHLSADNPSAMAVDFKEHTQSNTITPIDVTGIKTVTNVSGITLYPNPANDVLMVQWGKPLAEKTEVSIADITGREVYKTTINMSQNNGTALVSLTALNSGIYIISIHAGAITYNSKMLVQH